MPPPVVYLRITDIYLGLFASRLNGVNQEAMRQAFEMGYVIRSQLTLCVDAANDPEPGIAVVAGNIRNGLSVMVYP